MDDQVRRAALRAAAKIALSLTALGCTSSVAVETLDEEPIADEVAPVPPMPEWPDEPPPETGLRPAPARAEALACNAPQPGEAMSIDETQLGCCLDMLEPIVPPNGDWDAWMTSPDPSALACCSVAAFHADQNQVFSEQVGWDTLWACCQHDMTLSPACTPWGPPMPPAFFDELDDIAALFEVA